MVKRAFETLPVLAAAPLWVPLALAVAGVVPCVDGRPVFSARSGSA
ncbi:MAG: hypothetical protein ACI4RD_01435 [Kiritimatiellia bacterium]